MSERWWLVMPDGARRRIDAGGITLGRAPRSDVVLASDRASRAQALIVLSSEGPQLLVLGRGTTLVNDVAVDKERGLAVGDRVALPGLALEVARSETDASESDSAWVLERSDGTLHGVARSPFRIGGGDDELILSGWPAHAIVLRIVGLALHASGDGLRIDGHALAEGESCVVARNGVIERAGERFTVVTGGAFGEGSTVLGSRMATAPRNEVELEFLPRGGRLFVREGGVERSVYLADKRCDLVALLLSPPEPARAGAFVDDDVLLVRVWGKELKARTDVNVLVHRTRKDLERAGIDPARIERVKGGGATRFTLADDTKVVLG